MYLKYGTIVLSDLYNVVEVKRNLVPSKSVSTLDIQGRNGLVFNGSKLNSLEYEIILVVESDTDTDYKIAKNDLRRILSDTALTTVQFNPDRFTYGLCTSEVEVVDYSNLNGVATFTITCFESYFQSVGDELFEGMGSGRIVNMDNNGELPAKPFVSVGFTKPAHYLQLENKETSERVLVGKYPQLSLGESKKAEYVLRDDCTDISGWLQSSTSLAPDRGVGGTFTTSSKYGGSFILSNFGSGSSTLWKGGAYRKGLSKQIDEFDVNIDFSFVADGINGDPHDKVYDDEHRQAVERRLLVYYPTTTMNVRKGPGTKYKKVGTIPKGYEIQVGYTITNGWIAFRDTRYNDGNLIYVSMKYMKSKYKTLTVTESTANFRVTKSVSVKATPDPNGKNVVSLKKGDVVRLIKNRTFTKNIDGLQYSFYETAKPIDGKYSGFVNIVHVALASEVEVEVESETISADDLTGILEIYGTGPEGERLFRVEMCDETEWYEANTVKMFVGDIEISTGQPQTPPPKTDVKNVGSASNPKYEMVPVRGGTWGQWNDIEGKWRIKRTKVSATQYEYHMELQRIKNGSIASSLPYKFKVDIETSKKLANLIIYIGSKNTDKAKMSGISVNNVEVIDTSTVADLPSTNIQFFQEGDIVDIDFNTRNVYLNESRANHLLDIGSRFFDINPGKIPVKFISDDTNIVIGATIREKWVGDE